MNWRDLIGWADPDGMQLKITQLETEAGVLTVERNSALLERDSARLSVDALSRTNTALTVANTALAESNVRLAHEAELEEMLCEEASFWLMTLPIASAAQFHKVHDWLVRCDSLLHDDDKGRPAE